MEFDFEPPSINDEFCDERKLIKDYGKKTGVGIIKIIGAIESAINAYDLMCIPQFQMHMLHGDKLGVYSLSPDNKKTRWRVLIKCINEKGEFIKPESDEIRFLKTIKKVIIERISDHYE